MTSHTVTALVELRREIMAEQVHLESEVARCRKAVDHIDFVIRLIEPEYDFSKVPGPKKTVTFDDLFRPGEAPLLAMDVLREKGGSLSTTDITKAMLERRGAPKLNFRQFEALNRKVNAALNSQFRQGTLRKAGRVQGENRAIVWEVVR